MKNLFLVLCIVIFLYGSDEEIIFWNDVKNSNDIELLKLYNEKYPNGSFSLIAKNKIKRLKKLNNIENSYSIPTWLKGYSVDYKYYAVGKANKHFKGKEYQKNLAFKRAMRVLSDKLENSEYSSEKQEELLSIRLTKEYFDSKDRFYILIYIDNDEL